MGAPSRAATVKYHYFHRFFTYSMVRRRALPVAPAPGQAPRLLALEGGQRGVPASPAPPIRVEDSVRWGVWLGRHICQRLTQVS